MTTHIDQIQTDVVPEPEADEAGPAEPMDSRWDSEEKLAMALERRRWLRDRLSAEGFDD